MDLLPDEFELYIFAFQLARILRSQIIKPAPQRLAQTLYKSCMNTEELEKKGLAPLKKVLKAVGGWPVLEGPDWDKRGFKWYDMVYKLRDIGYPTNYIIGISVFFDWYTPSQRVVYLGQRPYGMVESRLKTREGFQVHNFIKSFF